MPFGDPHRNRPGSQSPDPPTPLQVREFALYVPVRRAENQTWRGFLAVGRLSGRGEELVEAVEGGQAVTAHDDAAHAQLLGGGHVGRVVVAEAGGVGVDVHGVEGTPV